MGVFLMAERRRRSWTRRRLVAEIRRAAVQLGEVATTGVQTVKNWELNGIRPQPDAMHWLARALDTPVERLVSLARGILVPEEDEDTRRRDFLTMLAAIGSGLADLERLAAPATDAAWLGDAEAVSAALAAQMGTVAPAALVPAALGHLSALEARLPVTADLTAATAHLAGSLLNLAGWPAPAWRHQALAETIGSNVVRARAMTGKASIHQRRGDVGRGLDLQEAAVTVLGRAPGRARAGVLARRAELRAKAGDDAGALRDLDTAATAIETGPHQWYLLGPKNGVELGAYRGSVLQLLGRHREAVGAYDWTLSRMDPAQLDWRARIAADRDRALAAS